MVLFTKSPISLVWVVSLLVAGGLVTLGTTLYWERQENRQAARVEKSTILVSREDLQVTIRASGTVEPIKNVNISPKNPGILAEILVEQGDVVEAGQLLARMDSSEITAQVQEAQANLKEAIASLAEFESRVEAQISQLQAQLAQATARWEQTQVSLPRQIEQNKAQVEAAAARFELSQERVRRNKYLFDQGATAQDELDAAINEFKNAQGNLAEAQQRLREAQNTRMLTLAELAAQTDEAQFQLAERQQTMGQERQKLQSLIESRQAQLELLQIRKQDTLLKAPFAGIISQRYANQGAFVTPTTSASTSAAATSTSIVALASGLEVIAKVPEIDITQLYVGQEVEIYPDAYPGKTFRGKIKLIAPEAIVEENVTSFEVRIGLLTGEAQLRSKMNVDVLFIGQIREQALTIPTVAIVTRGGETGVMIVGENNAPVFQPVTLGVTLETKTEILTGLKAGDRVFTDLPN